MRLKRWKSWAAVLIMTSVVTLVLYPRKAPVAPAIRLQVLGVDGNPAKDVLVKQEWVYVSLIPSEGKEYARTDEGGYVSFPERHAGESLLSRALLPFTSLLAHSGHGPMGVISAYGDDPHVWTTENHSVTHPGPPQLRLKAWGTTLRP